MGKAFVIDDKIKQAVDIITGLVMNPSEISIGYDDIKVIQDLGGNLLISVGRGSGKNRAVKACQDALNNPWKELIVKEATVVLVNITGPLDLCLEEVNEVLNLIKESVAVNAAVNFGVARDSSLRDQVRVTLLGSMTEEGNRLEATAACTTLTVQAGGEIE